VLLNGRRVGRTPVTVDGLAAGTYEVTFLFPNDQSSLPVELAQGEYKKVHMQAAPP